jgi:hypothetical protein
MKPRFISRAALLLLPLYLFCGCSGLPFAKKSKANEDFANSSLASAESVQAQQSPFVMAAESSGNVITFAITNNSSREYTVSPYHFALIVQGTRRVVPYSPEIATIDVPARLGPGETIMGRAIFNEFPAPEGHKLVFKPDSNACFAVITSSFNPLKTVPKNYSAAPKKAIKASKSR